MSTSTRKPNAPSATPVSDWKTPNLPTELPSGKFMKLKKSSFRVFLSAGVIPNSLMAIVQKSLNSGGNPELEGFEDDPEKLEELMRMVDDVTIFVAQEPRVYSLPKKVRDEETGGMIEGPRDPDKLYVDEVDEEDKMYIFQYSTGGVKDLEQFRRESAEQLATLQSSETLDNTSE